MKQSKRLLLEQLFQKALNFNLFNDGAKAEDLWNKLDVILGGPWAPDKPSEPVMTEYLVTWKINLHAESEIDAAKRAAAILMQRDPNSTATTFDVSIPGDSFATRIDASLSQENPL